MDRDKLPLPRPQVTTLALRAYIALQAFQEGTAAPAHWASLAEVLNTINALSCLGKPIPNVSPAVLKALYLAFRSVELSEGLVELDESLMPPLATVVCAYESCLSGLARRTIGEAMSFIDRCVEEQESMDLDVWCAHYPHPPMFSGDELPCAGHRDTGKLSLDIDSAC